MANRQDVLESLSDYRELARAFGEFWGAFSQAFPDTGNDWALIPEKDQELESLRHFWLLGRPCQVRFSVRRETGNLLIGRLLFERLRPKDQIARMLAIDFDANGNARIAGGRSFSLRSFADLHTQIAVPLVDWLLTALSEESADAPTPAKP